MNKNNTWWRDLKPGDKVFVPMGRNKQSGMAEVYSNGKKYIHVSLNGIPIRIRKESGCVDHFPNFQIRRDREDHMESLKQRKAFSEVLDGLNALSRAYDFRVTAAHVSKAAALFREMAEGHDDDGQ